MPKDHRGAEALTEPLPHYLTKPELARVLKVTPRCIDYWVAQGRIPSIKINGRCVRFLLSEIEQHLAEKYRRKAAGATGGAE